ncbi:MAG TPA: HNH endonuclease, partial [Devosia sp.]
FQVARFHRLDPIASEVKQFLGGKLPPQGDRASAVWDDVEDFKIIEPAKGMAGDDDEDGFPEGKESYKQHRSRERNRKAVKLAKLRRFEDTGKLECEACSFDFVKTYGDRAAGFIEAHHTTPFASTKGITRVRVKDFALVCSNCHRMLHRLRPMMTAQDLKEHLAATAARR